MGRQKLTDIKKFWDEQAQECGTDFRATLKEKHLRFLEIKTMKQFIRKYQPNRVLDAGCGNGYSTRAFAEAFPEIQFTGIDYSESMIAESAKHTRGNLHFLLGDVTDLSSLPRTEFDLVITQRCIQNLPDYPTQRVAIDNLRSLRSPKGVLLLMECSKEGVRQLNMMRTKFGKTALDNIEAWHNTFLDDTKLYADYAVTVVYFSSTYMFLTKVISQRLALPASLLPAFGNFGYDRIYKIE